MNFKLSDGELLALLDLQSPNFPAEMSVAFQTLLDNAAKAGHEATVQDVATLTGTIVRAKAASLANAIANAQLDKLVAALANKGIQL